MPQLGVGRPVEQLQQVLHSLIDLVCSRSPTASARPQLRMRHLSDRDTTNPPPPQQQPKTRVRDCQIGQDAVHSAQRRATTRPSLNAKRSRTSRLRAIFFFFFRVVTQKRKTHDRPSSPWAAEYEPPKPASLPFSATAATPPHPDS